MTGYSLVDPTICGFYRTAVYLVSSNKPLIPVLPDKKDDISNTSSNDLNLSTTFNDSGYNTDLSIISNISFDDPLEISIECDVENTHSTPNKPKKHLKTEIPLEEGFEELQQFFDSHFCANTLQFSLFKKNLARFVNHNKLWSKHNAKEKNLYYEHFKPENWLKLAEKERKKHSKHCEECNIKHTKFYSLFSTKSKKFSKENNENLQHALLNSKKQIKKPMKDVTNLIYKTINPAFQKKFGTSFAESLTTVKELNLQKKPSSKEKKLQETVIIKSAFGERNKQLNGTAIDR